MLNCRPNSNDERLLYPLRVRVRSHKRIEYREHMPAIIHHARKNIAKLRIAFCLAVPFGKHHRGDFDVPSKLVRGMATQEQTVKESCLTLREVEIVDDFGRNKLWHRGHKENAVYRKA